MREQSVCVPGCVGVGWVVDATTHLTDLDLAMVSLLSKHEGCGVVRRQPHIEEEEEGGGGSRDRCTTVFVLTRAHDEARVHRSQVGAHQLGFNQHAIHVDAQGRAVVHHDEYHT